MAKASSPPPPSQALLSHPLSCPTHRPPPPDLATSWILEFILRQPIPDHLAHEIFLSLPFSSLPPSLPFSSPSPSLHPHLRKTLLLRRLSSDILRRSLSDSTLHSMELMEELDRLRGAAPSPHLKAAYCAAAVACTASALRRSAADFADAVERIWMTRIADLVRSEAAAGLVSEDLFEWGKRMERWRSTEEGREKLLDRNVEEAVRVLGDYMESAMEEMGPPFLEIAATEVLENRMNLSGSAEMEGDVLSGVAKMNHCFGRLEGKGLEDDGIGEKREGLSGALEDGGIRERSGDLEEAWKELNGAGVREEFGGLGDAYTEHGDDFHGAVEAEEHANVSGQDTTDHGGGGSHKLDSGEVRRVKMALKKSSFDLQMLFEDPLPKAEAIAAAVLASMAGDNIFLNETAKHNSKENTVLPDSPGDLVAGVSAGVDSSIGALEKEKCNLVPLPDFVRRKPLDFKPLECHHTVKECNKDAKECNKDAKECSKDAEPSKNGDIAHHNLFERNPTAHTREWSDDSLKSSLETSPVAADKHHPPNQMTRRNFLPRLDKKKLGKRRAIKRWSSLEEHTLREAVAKYGKGNWKFILYYYSKIFEERTEVDLKDKWRNISRNLS